MGLTLETELSLLLDNPAATDAEFRQILAEAGAGSSEQVRAVRRAALAAALVCVPLLVLAFSAGMLLGTLALVVGAPALILAAMVRATPATAERPLVLSR
jgi:hypothetical protein